ncbi:DUF2586 domain-containing protein [Oscillibacter sp.]|uniref:DUF2586 domain-containing protein n=1 Tax=Oscillibacter sp. TaxID=1945593 RepID=UPI0028AFEA58|nr:DUF2586 domain-containing protein [Oscillibacter sp.]
MLRDVTHKVTDGLLGLSTTKGDGLHVKIGVSPIVSDAPILIVGDMSADKIKAALGLSPLADAAMDSVQWGSSKLYCIPVAASTPGTVGLFNKTGTGFGSLTIAGSPTNAFGILVKITAQGTLNTASFAYSIDGGYSFSDDITVPLSGAYEIPGTGLTVTFVEATEAEQKPSSFLVGDSYAAASTAPTMTNADVLAAIDKLRTIPIVFEFVHIVGESIPALWQAVSAAQLELQDTYKKPLFFTLEAYTPEDGEDMLTYALRMEADRAKVANYNIQVVAARGLLVKLDGTTQDVNLAGLVSGLYAKSSVQVCVGKVREEAGFGIPKDSLLELRPEGIREVIERLDTAGYLTFRDYDGIDYFYVYNARMLSPSGSDYRYAEDVRVLNKIIRETRKEAIPILKDDIDLEDVQGELETRARFMFPPLQKMIEANEISSAEITVPDGQAETILDDEKMRVKIRYLSRGYIREIEVDLGRAQAKA